MKIFAALQGGYNVGLLALMLYALWRGTPPMKRTIATVLGVCAVAWGVSPLWPSLAYAVIMIAVDSIACRIIVWHPAGRWQSVVGWSYILQIGTHLGYIASILFTGGADMHRYYWGLSVVAIAQLFLIAGWGAHGWFGRAWSWVRPYLPPRASRFQGVEG